MWLVSNPFFRQTLRGSGTPGNGVVVQSAKAQSLFGTATRASSWCTRMVNVSPALLVVTLAYPGVFELDSARMFCVEAGTLTVHSERTTPVMVCPLWVAMGTATIVISPGFDAGATRSACQPAQTSVRPRVSRKPSPCGFAALAPML